MAVRHIPICSGSSKSFGTQADKRPSSTCYTGRFQSMQSFANLVSVLRTLDRSRRTNMQSMLNRGRVCGCCMTCVKARAVAETGPSRRSLPAFARSCSTGSLGACAAVLAPSLPVLLLCLVIRPSGTPRKSTRGVF